MEVVVAPGPDDERALVARHLARHHRAIWRCVCARARGRCRVVAPASAFECAAADPAHVLLVAQVPSPRTHRLPPLDPDLHGGSGVWGCNTKRMSDTISIIGAGPVGCLAALYFAKSGRSVNLYDLRKDPRGEAASLEAKSINLAVSERGITALREADESLVHAVLEGSVPMKGRMIHDVHGNLASHAYDVHGRHINSVDRSKLNTMLISVAEAHENVTIYFEHRLVACHFEEDELEFSHCGTKVTTRAGLVIGADGAHSKIREILMRKVNLDYSQTYIDTLWSELYIPPDPSSSALKPLWSMHPHRLHIWPRGSFMFIALPNQDGSFTCTLFMPPRMFAQISDRSDLISFFQTHFPDALELIGEERLAKDYFESKKLPLISIKCKPYHYAGRCVIVGDAAHAQIPFYGQGMNTGFESVRLLHKLITDPSMTQEEALAKYSEERWRDAHAVCDLSMGNHTEMREKVNQRLYLVRKAIEETLDRYVPSLGIRTLYSRVSFSNERYHEALIAAERQGAWLSLFLRSGFALLLLLLIRRWRNRNQARS